MGNGFYHQAHSSVENVVVGGSKSRTRKEVSYSSSTSLRHNLPLPHHLWICSSEYFVQGVVNLFSFAGLFLLLLSKGYFTPPYFAPLNPSSETNPATVVLLEVVTSYRRAAICQAHVSVQYPHLTKSSPFPLAIALKKGDTSLPETSSGCMVIPSLTALYPFSTTIGTHPNHTVSMLPWIFASYRWERSQENTDDNSHTANK